VEDYFKRLLVQFLFPSPDPSLEYFSGGSGRYRLNNKQIRLYPGCKDTQNIQIDNHTRAKRTLPACLIAFYREAVGNGTGQSHLVGIFQFTSKGDAPGDGSYLNSRAL
jgi:hypothetical protein